MEQKRKCIACAEVKPRSELIRITKEHKCGDIVIQPNAKTFGRSVYLCYNKDCIDIAFKKNKINKMLKTGINVNKECLLNLIRDKNEG